MPPQTRKRGAAQKPAIPEHRRKTGVHASHLPIVKRANNPDFAATKSQAGPCLNTIVPYFPPTELFTFARVEQL